jgi:hypothetical protein
MSIYERIFSSCSDEACAPIIVAGSRHDRSHSLKGALHEAIIDRFLNKRAARAGADLVVSPVNAILAMRLEEASVARFDAKAVHDVEDTFGQEICDEF